MLPAVLLLAALGADGATADHRLSTAPHPQGRTTLEIVEPEGASVEVFDGRRRIFEDDVPASFEGRGERWYRVLVRKGERAWEKKLRVPAGQITTLAVLIGEPAGPPRPPSMTDDSFKELLLSVDATRIWKEKVNLVKLAAQRNWFEATQVGRLVDLTPISQDKLAMLEAVKGRIVDRENTFKIYGHLKLDGDKARARAILEP